MSEEKDFDGNQPNGKKKQGKTTHSVYGQMPGVKITLLFLRMSKLKMTKEIKDEKIKYQNAKGANLMMDGKVLG